MLYEGNLEEETELTVDDLFSKGQIRLAELSVCNWGSFSNITTVEIDAQGTLVTGETGAGKSTLIDGLMALLQRAGSATFNVAAAQGAKGDRDLMSYIRGSYGNEHDGDNTKIKNKRTGAVITGLRALYKADDDSLITLAALFWVDTATQQLSDVKRLYIVANRNLTIESLRDNFPDANKNILNRWLDRDPAITYHHERFTGYEAAYQKALYIENKKAPNLLGRALGLKKIDDLTAIIRDLVLEQSTVKNDARDVVSEFNDTMAMYQKVVDARTQQESLTPLVDVKVNLDIANESINKFSAQKKALPTYIYKQAVILCDNKKSNLEEKAGILESKLKTITQEEKDADIIANGRHGDYVRSGGGRIEALANEIGQATLTLNRTTIKAGLYQEDVQELALPDTLKEAVFNANKNQAVEGLASHFQSSETNLKAFIELSGQFSEQQKKESILKDEIKEIEQRPDSNIDIKYQQLRDVMVDDLSLSRDQCMFIGELIDIKEEQRDWQGAIERVLGMHRLTLAIPSHSFSKVTKWLNERHTGLYVRVQVVNASLKHAANFKEDGFLRKLEWRKHEYRDWAKNYLASYDLHCVDSTQALDKTLYSMTKQGLVHYGEGSFEKKDQHKITDRRQWYVGFSNKSRLTILKQDLKELGEALAQKLEAVQAARKILDKDKAKESLWHKLSDYNWEEIDAPYWNRHVIKLTAEKAELELADDDLAKAKLRWDAAREELELIQGEKGKYQVQSGGLARDLKSAESELARLTVSAAGAISPEIVSELDEMVTRLIEEDLDKLATILMQYTTKIEDAYSHQARDKSTLERKAVGCMSAFRAKDEWKAITAEWSADLNAIPDYLAHLEHITNEGLPELVTRWIKRLDEHATQSLAKINSRLESEREDIIERIETVSMVLERTEFRPGTALKLMTRPEASEHGTRFTKELTKALSLSTSDDYEERYQQLATVMGYLRKASDPATVNAQESLKMLDPRYQMTFIAEEVNQETNEVLDVWRSSDGKSGGEKESFAGAIIAASLAYVLTPDGYNKPVYSTVFLDEAFSNMSEVVSRRILKIFKDLHIHVNLITPYKNIALARESSRSILMVEMIASIHESRFSTMTWEKVDRDLARHKALKLEEEAADLGIEIGN
jgi:uncharacterized protein YPO0396